MKTATLTELLRTPKEVIAHAESEAVHISRRDGEDLVILLAGELEREHDGIALASRIMRAALRHSNDFEAALREQFPWTAYFSQTEMRQYAADMERCVWSSAELGEYGQLLNEQRSWEGTAEVYGAGLTPLPNITINDVGSLTYAERPGDETQ